MPSVADYLAFSDLAYVGVDGLFAPGYDNDASNVQIPQGWLLFSDSTLLFPSATFYAIVFYNLSTDEVMIAFRGTENFSQVTGPDLAIGRGVRPSDFNIAEQFVQAVMGIFSSEYPQKNFTYEVTGHSLGGAEAEDVAAKYDLGGMTFAAPGVTNLLQQPVATLMPPLVNYVMTGDLVGNDTGKPGLHVGSIVTVPPSFTPSPLPIQNPGIYGFVFVDAPAALL